MKGEIAEFYRVEGENGAVFEILAKSLHYVEKFARDYYGETGFNIFPFPFEDSSKHRQTFPFFKGQKSFSEGTFVLSARFNLSGERYSGEPAEV